MQRLVRGFAEGQREELEHAGLRIDTLDEMCPATADMEVIWQLMPAIDVMYAHQLHPVRVSRLQVEESIALLKRMPWSQSGSAERDGRGPSQCVAAQRLLRPVARLGIRAHGDLWRPSWMRDAPLPQAGRAAAPGRAGRPDAIG